MKREIRAQQFAIFSIMMFALIVRLAGIGFGLPDLFHQDEPVVVNHALAYANGDFNPHFFKIPPLLSYLLFGVYGLIFTFLKIFMHFSKDQFAQFFFKDPTLFYLSGRILFGACLGTASVYLLYLLGTKIFNKNTALIAAAFFSLNYLHVRDSHYLYVDIPMIFSIGMCLLALCRYQENIRLADLGWSSFWAAVSVAFKYIAAPVVAPVFGVLITTHWQNGKLKPSFFVHFLFFSAVLLVTYSLLNPFQLLDHSFFMNEILNQSASEGRMPILHHLTYSLYGGQGKVTVLLGIAGMLLAFFKAPRSRWVWTLPVVYYGMITLFSQPYERYAMPIIPFLCLSAAYGIDQLWRRDSSQLLKVIIGIIRIFTTIYLPSRKVIYLDRLLMKLDTRTEAKRWLWAKVRQNAVVILDHPFFSPRLTQTKEQFLSKLSRIRPLDTQDGSKRKKIEIMMDTSFGNPRYQVYYAESDLSKSPPFLLWSPMVTPDPEALKKIGAEYYVRFRYPEETPDFEKNIKSRAQLMQVFSPYRDPSKRWTVDRWAHVALPFEDSELFSRTMPGPYLEIYRLEQSS